MNHEIYDNTKLADHKTCPRKYYYRHIRNWRGEGLSPPLLFGLGWHAMMDTAWRFCKELARPDLLREASGSFIEEWEKNGGPVEIPLEVYEKWTPRVPAIAGEMLINYLTERQNFMQGCTLLESEQPFVVPILPNVPGVWYAGKKDKRVVAPNGDTLVIEHKTTSEYRKDGGFKPDYIESWYMNSQIFGYLYSDNILSQGNTRAVFVDVALVHKTVHNRFRFVPVDHKYAQLDQWLWDTRKRVECIREETKVLTELRSNGKSKVIQIMPVFGRNEESCYGKYGQKCPYFNICTQYPNPEQLDIVPPGMVEEVWDPVSILKLDKLEKEIGPLQDKPGS